MLHKISEHALIISLATAIILSAVAFWGWNRDQQFLKEAQEENLELAARFISDLFLGVIDDDIQTLENLKGRIEETEGAYFDYWDYDARLMLNQHPSFTLVEWIDSLGIIRRIEPEAGNQNAIGLNILELDYRRDDWLTMKRDSITNLTQWMPLVQGGEVFLADAPVYYNGTFQGSITAGMDFKNQFDEIMTGREMYNIQLRDGQGTLFYTFPDNANNLSETEQVIENELQIPSSNGKYWTFKIQPNTQFIEQGVSESGLFSLILRISLTSLFGIAVFFMITAFKSTLAYKKALREKEILISEIHHRVKNNLAVITSLIEIQSGEVEDEKMSTILRNTQNRIYSIAEVHEVLYSTKNFSEISFETYLKNLFNYLFEVYDRDETNTVLKLNIEKKKMSINQAIPVGLLMNELAVNSFKHAFKNQDQGEIHVDVMDEGEFVRIIYQDNGKGFNVEKFETGTSMGLTIIKTLLQQLESEYAVENGNGFSIDFVFPDLN